VQANAPVLSQDTAVLLEVLADASQPLQTYAAKVVTSRKAGTKGREAARSFRSKNLGADFRQALCKALRRTGNRLAPDVQDLDDDELAAIVQANVTLVLDYIRDHGAVPTIKDLRPGTQREESPTGPPHRERTELADDAAMDGTEITKYVLSARAPYRIRTHSCCATSEAAPSAKFRAAQCAEPLATPRLTQPLCLISPLTKATRVQDPGYRRRADHRHVRSHSNCTRHRPHVHLLRHIGGCLKRHIPGCTVCRAPCFA
jgi:hypothetical protein